jgi:lysophospholipase L1-like esterase
VAASLVVSVLLAEGVVRWLDPGHYAGGRFLTADGREVPLTEIAHFLRFSGEYDRNPGGPRSRMAAHWNVRAQYDRPRWDYFDDRDCISLTTNSLGFRDLELGVAKPAGELRVLALGDSFTYGQGVQLEDTWVQVLERLLRQARGSPVEVINAGFAAGGHSPPGYVGWLRSDGLQFEPDAVIVGFCLNDMSSDVPLLAYPKAEPAPLLGGASKLLSLIQRELEQRRLRAQRRDFTDVVRKDPAAWEETKAALLEMRDLLRERGVRVAVAVMPMMSQLGENYPYLGLHEMVDDFCRAHDIACVDLLPRLRGMAEEDLWVHPTDQHPNHVAHRKIAEGVCELVLAQGWAR